MPSIAAVMCTWAEPYMAPIAVESVADYVDEIICINKPDKYNTGEIITEACTNHGVKLKLFNSDLKLRYARLYALKKTKCEYVVILDGDEVYHTDGRAGAHKFHELIEAYPDYCFRAPMNYLYLDFLHTRTTQPQRAGHKFLYPHTDEVTEAGVRDLPHFPRVVNLPMIYKFNCGVKPLERIYMRRRYWWLWSKQYKGSLDFEDWLFKEHGKTPLDLVPDNPYSRDDVVMYDEVEHGRRPKIINRYIQVGNIYGAK